MDNQMLAPHTDQYEPELVEDDKIVVYDATTGNHERWSVKDRRLHQLIEVL